MSETIEETSVERFINSVMQEVRPKGTSAAVTLVLLTAARAAANAANRNSDGTIDENQASQIFKSAAVLMCKLEP